MTVRRDKVRPAEDEPEAAPDQPTIARLWGELDPDGDLEDVLWEQARNR